MSTPISFITMKEEEGYKPATLFKKYKQDMDRPIAAILSLNTIANTVGAAGVGHQSTIVFGDAFFGVVSAVTTLLILVFSEIIPKTIGTSYWKKLMGFTVSCLRVIIFLMYPVVSLIRLLSKLFASKESELTISREEVSAMVNVGEEEGVFEESENKIIQNLIKLDNVKAYDAMTPRVVASIAPETMTFREYYEDEAYEHHSRIPVYGDSPDYITGYVLRSDILEELTEDKFDVMLGDVRRDISFFNEEMSISEIWENMLQRKEQIGIVIDEYGSFSGILTLEDIIETIFGLEIIDENDEVTDMQQYAKDRWEKRQKRFKKIQLNTVTKEEQITQ